ncbi:MAG: type II secretion system protein GspN [Myxococcota bacterium]
MKRFFDKLPSIKKPSIKKPSIKMPSIKMPFDVDAWLQKRWARRTLYAGFFTMCFVLFAYWSFPYDRLRDHIIQQVEYPQGPGGRQPSGWELDIVELSPSWGTGLTLEGVRMAKRSERPGDEPVAMRVDELTVRASPFAYLVGNEGLSFDADLGEGEVFGEYERSDTSTFVEADIESVDMGKLRILRGYMGIPFAGVLDGAMQFTIAEEPADTEGELELSIRGLRIGDSRAKLRVQDMNEGLTIERIDAGDLTWRMTAEQGVARIDELKAAGEDAEIHGSGTVRLLQPLDMSRLDAMLRIGFADSYRNKNDRTRALFSLMEFNPKVRKARTPDGALQWRFTGSLNGRLVPSPAGKAKTPTRATAN